MAALLHLPLTPAAGLLPFLAAALQGPGEDWDYEGGEVVIPITLEAEPVVQAVEAVVEAAEEPASGAEAEAATKKEERARREVEGLDAGVPDAESPDEPEADAEAETDADALDAGLPDAADGEGEDAVAGEVDGGAGDNEDAGEAGGAIADAGGEGERVASADLDAGAEGGLGDTLGLAGGLSKTVSGKPNIALVLWFGPLREHPSGRTVSEILQCEPQWKEFLGGAMDPVRDFEGVMLTGPRFSDSSKLTVAVQHRLGAEEVAAIVKAMVERSGDFGGFVDAGAGEVVARAFADRAERMVFTHPRDMVFITPSEGYAQIRAIQEPLSLPPSEGRAISLTLVNPWRPMRAFRVKAPETLTELRLDITMTNDGGATVSVEFDDKDAETAKASAKTLTDEMARSPIGSFVSGREFMAEGSRIVGTIRLSRLTSALVLGFLRAAACPEAVEGGI